MLYFKITVFHALLLSSLLTVNGVFAQGNYNSEILKAASQMNLNELQNKVDAMSDPGMLGMGFLKRCRAASLEELYQLLQRTEIFSKSFNYVFSELMRRGVNPTKRYSSTQIGEILNRYKRAAASSWISLFESEFVTVRLKKCPMSN